jgi:hypothetical protein
MEPLVGITGYARHGKDTAAQVLVDEYGYLRVGFADALKSMSLAVDPLIPTAADGTLTVVPGGLQASVVVQRLSQLVQTEGWEAAKKHPEVRRFLQALGSEGVRDHIEDGAWVLALDRKIAVVWDDYMEVEWRAAGYDSNPFEKYSGVVVPDVRFENEADYIHYNEGVIVRVVRPNFDNGVGTDHPSEAYIPRIDADIVLEATSVDQLQNLMRGVMRERFV